MTSKTQHTSLIKKKAYELGFSFVGFSEADFLEKEAYQLEKWLNQNHNGMMGYMSNHFDKRTDPRKLVEGAKSVISLAYNYFTSQHQQDIYAPKISKYAFGVDYHYVIKDKLNELYQYINDKIKPINGRVFVDSAPVLEKAWAEKSGIGWIGKNSNLLTKEGSFFFLGELIIDLELEADGPIKDYCGTCTKCIDACPTDAIVGDKIVDGSKCISYFTIELRDEIPNQMKGKFESWMFGCDICQDVCPWNRFSNEHKESLFNPNDALLKMNRQEWNSLSKETFNEVFKKSPVKRTRYSGLIRNIKFLEENIKKKHDNTSQSSD